MLRRDGFFLFFSFSLSASRFDIGEIAVSCNDLNPLNNGLFCGGAWEEVWTDGVPPKLQTEDLHQDWGET